MIATTIEQSKRLLELGLDPNTADMYYTGHRSIYNPKEIEYTQVPRVRAKFVSFDRLEVFFPAWSLQALLEVMPYNYYNHFSLCQSSFAFWDCVFRHEGKEIVRTVSTNKDGEQDPISAAYEMVVWLLENGYIKKGGEQ